MRDQNYHANSGRVVTTHQPRPHHHPSDHTRAPQYLSGHDLRCQARDAGIQDSFRAVWYLGRSCYQPAPARAPSPHPLPDALVPGKRKNTDFKAQWESIRREAEVLEPQVEAYELEGVEVKSIVELEGHVSSIKTTGVSEPSTSKRSSMVHEFSHMVPMITFSFSLPSPVPQAADEDLTYFSHLITAGHTPPPLSPPSPTPSSAPPTPPLTPPSTPSSTPASSPAIGFSSPASTPPSTPPLLPAKPRAYQPPINYEACIESKYRDSTPYYPPPQPGSTPNGGIQSQDQHRQIRQQGDDGEQVLRVKHPSVPGWTYR